YLDDQNLHPDEPFFIQDAQLSINPWRVLYRWPWDTFARKYLYPTFGIKRGHMIRQSVPKFMLAFIGFEFFYYYVKYCHETWKDAQRVATMTLHPQIANRDMIEDKYPGLIEKAYPVFSVGNDFYDLGFKQRTYFRNLGETQRPW
uniref:NADH dehydrogenase [ubiquinone] 1 beta subcomplex subunit 6 n=1 Tax=Romanomermis culicivorax TaxID=13658 RepID=A0A915JMH2_ROMCU